MLIKCIPRLGRSYSIYNFGDLIWGRYCFFSGEIDGKGSLNYLMLYIRMACFFNPGAISASGNFFEKPNNYYFTKTRIKVTFKLSFRTCFLH